MEETVLSTLTDFSLCSTHLNIGKASGFNTVPASLASERRLEEQTDKEGEVISHELKMPKFCKPHSSVVLLLLVHANILVPKRC